MASITTVPDKASGDVFDETMWDSYIKDNINNGIVTQLGCRVYNSGNITPGSSLTALTFDSERFDNDTMHSTATNPERITIQTAGVYAIGAHASWEAGTATHRLQIRVNGTDTIAGSSLTSIGGGNVTNQSLVALYNFSAADYVEVLAASSDAALRVMNTAKFSPEFWACRL